jgi:predicted enzyme related to lactoylglutathione lyase
MPMRCAILAVTLAAGFVFVQDQAKPTKAHSIDVGAGHVAWFDITTTKMAPAKEFYGKLFDWKFTSMKGTDLAAQIVAGDTTIGSLRVAEGAISSYNGVVYIQVDDSQASCNKAKELGAKVVPGFPFNLNDGTGAIGLFTDPCGHPMGVYSKKSIPAEKPAGK